MVFYSEDKLKRAKEEYLKRISNINNSRKIHLIGMGGSYLATKAILDIIEPKVNINFVGPELEYNFNDMSSNDYFIIVSKSGSTFEVKYIINKLGPRIHKDNTTIITDKDSCLDLYAKEKGLKSILHTDKEIGGRFSAFDVSTLFPLCVTGINIDNYISSIGDYSKEEFDNFLNTRKEKADIELVSTNNKKLISFTRWYQQLFAESQGKDGRGTFPTLILYPRDLHSLEQMIVDGGYKFIETNFSSTETNISTAINNAALESHRSEGIQIVEIKNLEPCLAKDELIIEVGRVISMMLDLVVEDSKRLGIDPFGQPGVEGYKRRLNT